MHRPDFFKDLGVHFDPKLNFIKHIESIVAGAVKIIGFVTRNCKGFKNIDTLRTLYVTFIRSRLEYASVVWSPTYNVHSLQLEKIQRRFLKSATYIIDGYYPQIGFPHEILLHRFNVCELDKRRVAASVIFLYKIVNNRLDCILLSNQIMYKVPRISSRNSNLFHLPTARTNILMSSPLYKMYINYTNLESQLDIFCTNPSQIKKICF